MQACKPWTLRVYVVVNHKIVHISEPRGGELHIDEIHGWLKNLDAIQE